jgi:hypothetical protein
LPIDPSTKPAFASIDFDRRKIVPARAAFPNNPAPPPGFESTDSIDAGGTWLHKT